MRGVRNRAVLSDGGGGRPFCLPGRRDAMRLHILLALLVTTVALAGCGDDGTTTPDADTSDGASPETPQTGATGTSTEGPEGKDPTASEERAPTIVYHESYTGTLPEAEPPSDTDPLAPLAADFPVPVPADATRLRVLYNGTYTGVISAIPYVYDPSGEERGGGTDCAFVAPGAMEPATCEVKIQGHPLDEGEWTVRLVWQVGETVDEYEVDITVWGLV